MIDWNTSNVPPAIDSQDEFYKAQRLSARVLIRTTDEMDVIRMSFGRYHHDLKDWVFEGMSSRGFTVTHWTSLNEPSTACFSPKNKE